ncbi:MAG: EF-P lysine aminoacylase EpmA [Hyphomicrobium aestuarii]|mgnify:CR=1 FL=1|nr:EF-P lysine aminoacylase EpmA [Hyphomicrobium aestuarii]
MTITPSAWWDRDRHIDRRARLIDRNRIKAALRAWFEAEGFTEVEPGCLQVSPGNEAHLHAFRTEHIGTDLARRELYLHTSPEFAMKKLLAAGEERIFAFAPVFRNREAGPGNTNPWHANEFTMLEWYRAGEPVEALYRDCREILRIAAQTTGRWVWSVPKRDAPSTGRLERFDLETCDLRTMLLGEIDQLAVADAFSRHAGIDLAAAYDGDAADASRFRAAAETAGVKTMPDDTWSDVFARVLTERVDPHLGRWRPELLTRYPISEAALAKPDPTDPRFAQRFELYVCGVELANGFAELTDPAEQARRFEAEMALKEARYGERYPIDADFLAALAHMPEASGCALGFDRLAMLATGARSVADVQWTPVVSN